MGAGLVEPDKSYRTIQKGELNWRTSENSVESSLHRSVMRIWQGCQTKIFDIQYLHNIFFEIFLLCYAGLVVLVHLHPVW
jgi:hypothetical protein